MSLERPAIPADIKRELMIECGHRCASCGEATSLEKAHIDLWKNEKEHKFENLLVLCAVCHTRSHNENWDRLTLREYKQRPWVARYRSELDGLPRAIAEFQLNLAPDQFGDVERNRVLAAVSAALDLCPGDVVILSIRAGSIIVEMELPATAVEALRNNTQLQEKVRELVAPVEVTKMTFEPHQQSPNVADVKNWLTFTRRRPQSVAKRRAMGLTPGIAKPTRPVAAMDSCAARIISGSASRAEVQAAGPTLPSPR